MSDDGQASSLIWRWPTNFRIEPRVETLSDVPVVCSMVAEPKETPTATRFCLTSDVREGDCVERSAVPISVGPDMTVRVKHPAQPKIRKRGKRKIAPPND